MSHNQLRVYPYINHPRAAQREVKIMRAIKNGPLYSTVIAHRIDCTCALTAQTLRALESDGLVERTNRNRNVQWRLVE